jgi:hypothetical protein
MRSLATAADDLRALQGAPPAALRPTTPSSGAAAADAEQLPDALSTEEGAMREATL